MERGGGVNIHIIKGRIRFRARVDDRSLAVVLLLGQGALKWLVVRYEEGDFQAVRLCLLGAFDCYWSLPWLVLLCIHYSFIVNTITVLITIPFHCLYRYPDPPPPPHCRLHCCC